MSNTSNERPPLLSITANSDGNYEGDFLTGKDFLASCSEATVYRDGPSVIKVMEPYNDRDITTFQERVKAALFIDSELGEGSLKLLGFYKSANGTPNPVFSQNFVDGRAATKKEIQSHMKSRGWTLSETEIHTDKYIKTYDGKILTAKDLDGDNVKVTKEGKTIVIDACIYISKSSSPTPPAKSQLTTTNPQLRPMG